MQSSRRRSRLVPLLTALILIPAGCAKTMVIADRTDTTGVVCGAWKAVSWSAKDTDRTIAEAKSNNAGRRAWCEASGK